MVTLEIIIISLALLILLLILIFLSIACKPWRFISGSSRARRINGSDIERPLVSTEIEYQNEREASCIQQTYGVNHKQKHSSADPNLVEGENIVLDIVYEPSEEVPVGQTLKCPLKNYSSEKRKSVRKEESSKNGFSEFRPIDIPDQRSCLTLKVISGPSRGLQYSMQSTNTCSPLLTLGRVFPSILLIKDSEVSGKHAVIAWNLNKLKWELVDLGSLNGTLLNSHAVHHPDSGSGIRNRGNHFELSNGDIITLGTTSKIHVQITSHAESQIPFRFGVASDPMALRRGGKKLPMEDVCFFLWPLKGCSQFGVFGICDGHGGAEAAKTASKMLPEVLAQILSDSKTVEKVLSQCDASDVLKDAFFQTETFMNHHYEGCTATVLLVWADEEHFFVQCANVGDSACVFNMDGEHIMLTEDHRISNHSERLRINGTGEPLKDGETRICGINLGRMLGDKFLKEQDPRFSSNPHVSRVLHVNRLTKAFAILASDGFWDVVGTRRAASLVVEMKGTCDTDTEASAEGIAYFLLNEARTLRTKDNTSIIYIDFDACKFAS